MARVITEAFEGSHIMRFSNHIDNGSSYSIVTTPVLDGARALQIGLNSTILLPLRYNGSGALVSSAEIFIGMFFMVSHPASNSNLASGSGPDEKHRLISFWSGSTGICTISIDHSTQKLRLMSGAFYIPAALQPVVGTFPITLLANSTQGQAITANTLYHLQVRVLLDGITSRVQVRLDDTLVIDWTSTLAGTLTDMIALHGSGSRFPDQDGEQWYDTLIVNDTAPAACAGGFSDDTWPGVRRIKVQLVSGPGFYAQFTPSPTVANYLNVDELPHDSDTTINYALSAGLTDSFPVAPHGLDATQVTFLAWFQEVIARKSAGTFKIKLGVRRAGVDYIDATGMDLGVSYDVFDSRRCTDPSSLTSWTSSGLNSTEVLYQSST